jgi:hypothetical protein
MGGEGGEGGEGGGGQQRHGARKPSGTRSGLNCG